jgi:hypothetical protein
MSITMHVQSTIAAVRARRTPGRTEHGPPAHQGDQTVLSRRPVFPGQSTEGLR